MEVVLETSDSQYIIRAYDAEKKYIWINHQVAIQDNIIITPQALIYPWVFKQPEDLTRLLDFSPVPEIVLIGTEKSAEFLSPKCLMIFYAHHIGVEVMNTQAACRTFNLLAVEKRNVVAGLMIQYG